jgi:hypothetical protein
MLVYPLVSAADSMLTSSVRGRENCKMVRVYGVIGSQLLKL